MELKQTSRRFFNRLALLIIMVISTTEVFSQELTISSVISSSGWTVSGTNPVTISVTSTSRIQNTDLQQYLNQGVDVIIKMASPTNGDKITIDTNVLKSAGGDATLTLKTDNIIFNNNSSIQSTSGRLNLILWAEQPVVGGGYISMEGTTINTNGGGLAMGGQNTTTSWVPYDGGAALTYRICL